MPKIKTRKGAAKRFRKTASGKIKRSQANKGHLKACKNAKRKRILRGGAMVSKSEEKTLRVLMPY
ncbi:MAG: 50S ribosomal protein L35 [Candidatus Omnitrophota bacterium]